MLSQSLLQVQTCFSRYDWKLKILKSLSIALNILYVSRSCGGKVDPESWFHLWRLIRQGEAICCDQSVITHREIWKRFRDREEEYFTTWHLFLDVRQWEEKKLWRGGWWRSTLPSSRWSSCSCPPRCLRRTSRAKWCWSLVEDLVLAASCVSRRLQKGCFEINVYNLHFRFARCWEILVSLELQQGRESRDSFHDQEKRQESICIQSTWPTGEPYYLFSVSWLDLLQGWNLRNCQVDQDRGGSSIHLCRQWRYRV